MWFYSTFILGVAGLLLILIQNLPALIIMCILIYFIIKRGESDNRRAEKTSLEKAYEEADNKVLSDEEKVCKNCRYRSNLYYGSQNYWFCECKEKESEDTYSKRIEENARACDFFKYKVVI